MYSRSNSGKNKIVKALNQVENAEKLIASLPRKYYKDENSRLVIRVVVKHLQEAADLIRGEFDNKTNYVEDV